MRGGREGGGLLCVGGVALVRPRVEEEEDTQLQSAGEREEEGTM